MDQKWVNMDQPPLLKLKDGFLLVLDILASRRSSVLFSLHSILIQPEVINFPGRKAAPETRLPQLRHYPGKWQGCMPKGCPPGIDKDNMLSPGDAFLGAFADQIWLLTPGILVCNDAWSWKMEFRSPQGHLREHKLSTLKWCTLRRRL